jgi:predicted phosphodiesterase
MMKEPVLILSDLHLGHRISRIETAESLRPLIAGAGTVIFNGDTWQELDEPFVARATAMLADLRSICTDEGVDTVFLTGNHDPGWNGPGWVELAGGRIVITHGDTLLPGGSPWKREILSAPDRVEGLWNLYPDAGHDIRQRIQLARHIARELCTIEQTTGRHFIQRAWDAAVPPKRALTMISSWLARPAAASRFCDLYFPKAEVIIFGHFHRHGTWLHQRRRIIDSGSFLNPGRAHWIEWHNGWLTRGEIDESPRSCRRGRRLNLWRFPNIDHPPS